MALKYVDVLQRLEVVEKIKNNPLLLITDLYIFDKAGNGNLLNLLYNISFYDSYILDYLLEALYKLPVFENTTLKFDGERLYVYMDTPFDGDEVYSNKGKIFKVNLFSRTFIEVTTPIDKVRDILAEDISFVEKEMSDFWKQFGDFRLKTRLKLAFNSFSPKKNKTGSVRVFDFFYFLTVKRSKVLGKVEEYKKDLAEQNARNKRFFDNRLKEQEKIKVLAPDFLKRVENKQKELRKFFSEYAYIEDEEMSIY